MQNETLKTESEGLLVRDFTNREYYMIVNDMEVVPIPIKDYLGKNVKITIEVMQQ